MPFYNYISILKKTVSMAWLAFHILTFSHSNENIQIRNVYSMCKTVTMMMWMLLLVLNAKRRSTIEENKYK